MKRIILLFIYLSVYCNSQVFSQSIIGTWSGDLDFGYQKLAIVVHINGQNANDVELDSPDQKAFGMKADSVNFNDTIYIRLNKIDATLTGKYNKEKDSLICDFKQNGKKINLNMERGYSPKPQLPKMQDPKDFPYIVEEFEINNPETNVKLSATLTIPYNWKADKIVILISGSGQQDRNEEIFGHKPFLVISDYLTRNGIAVIRYDDRGVGKSTGDVQNATSYDFSIDAESFVKYIKSNEKLKDLKIGLIGHSEGGMIAPMIAARNSDIDFIVMLAGPGVPITRLMKKQVLDIMQTSGFPKEIIDLEVKTKDKIYKIACNKKLTMESKKEKALETRIKSYQRYPENQLNGADIEEISRKEIDIYFSPWMYYFINQNPQKYLEKITIPVLALNGDKDLQVNSKENLSAIETSLKKAKNKNYKIIETKSQNHMFQNCIFGSPDFYGKNKETFNENSLKTISDWILNLQ